MWEIRIRIFFTFVHQKTLWEGFSRGPELVDGYLVHEAVLAWGEAFLGLPKSRGQRKLRELSGSVY